MTRDLMIQVPGPDIAAKADALAAKMEGVLAGTGIKIRRPSRPGNVRMRGIDDTVSREEVLAALASASKCPEGEVRLGELWALPSGLKTAWVQCPISATKRLVAAKTVPMGWVLAQVEALKARPLRCYRCLRAGHVDSSVLPLKRTARRFASDAV
ncbi:uncharacterized protein LOC109862494 [Pseudomyrmex gracilis]|uniref:uncharacterized protein LOC109862494 n=1 Tax=Pseudomyrmex gracilis TaxID=219809 RepID=UPI000995612A|nr:uncharacterized protein LOC109862494 [Pseudomyrmex gracilis]